MHTSDLFCILLRGFCGAFSGAVLGWSLSNGEEKRSRLSLWLLWEMVWQRVQEFTDAAERLLAQSIWNNQGDWENGLIKWFAWVIFSVWNAVVNTLICFHPSCLSTPLSPWNWVTLWFWPLLHRCKKRPLWCCRLKYFTFEGSASWVRFWDRWYSQKSLPVCFYLIRTAHLGSDFQSKELLAWLLTTGLKHFQ